MTYSRVGRETIATPGFFMFIIMILLQSGCVSPVYHSYTKNYELGNIYTANIGEPLVKINDSYCMSKPMYKYAESQEDFTVKARYKRLGLFNEYSEVMVQKKVSYKIDYVINHEDHVYYVLLIPDTSGNTLYGMMVDSSGILSDSKFYVGSDGVKTEGDIKIAPAAPHFTMLDKSDCSGRLNGFDNFELLYGGVSDVSMTITYREFTPDNLAKPAFYQNLVYKTNAKQISFKDFKIDVVEADNEKIKYKVIQEPRLVDSQFIPGTDEVFERIRYQR